MIEKVFSSKKTLAILAALIVVVIAVFIFLTTRSEAVAKIGTEKITKNDLYTFFVEQSGASAVDTLITKSIIEQEVEKEKVSVNQEEIDEELQKLIESYGGQEVFEQTLASSGLTQDLLEVDIQTNLQL